MRPWGWRDAAPLPMRSDANSQGAGWKRPLPQRGLPDDLAAGTVTCPAGNVPHLADLRHPDHWQIPVQSFQFDPAVCGVWPLGQKLANWQRPYGDSPSPRERSCNKGPSRQSESFAEYRSRRQVVEHRLARLQLGVRQPRYFARLSATAWSHGGAVTLGLPGLGMMSQASGSTKPENTAGSPPGRPPLLPNSYWPRPDGSIDLAQLVIQPHLMQGFSGVLGPNTRDSADVDMRPSDDRPNHPRRAR